MGVSILAVFAAGLLSFLSPCVLPLVPGYVSMLSGIGVEQLRQGQKPRNSLMSSALAFVFGLSSVFIALGATASAVGQFLSHHRALLAPIAGAIVILFGLHLIGVLSKLNWAAGLAITVALVLLGMATKIHPGLLGDSLGQTQLYSLALIPLLGPWLSQWLNRDVHFRNLGGTDNQKEPSAFAGILSGFLMGVAFAAGWTPCIGPILAGVLTVAATTQSVTRGVFLLAIYSAGLAIPFLLFALAIERFLSFYKRVRKYIHMIEIASGVLLLVVGLLIFTNRLTLLSGKLSFLNRFIQ